MTTTSNPGLDSIARIRLPGDGHAMVPSVSLLAEEIWVDLHDIPVIDSARIAWLLHLRSTLGGRRLLLVGVSSRVRVQFRQLGLDQVCELAA